LEKPAWNSAQDSMQQINLLAYVDPGSGALIWQMLAAAAVGVLFYFRSFFRGMGKFFRRLVGKGDNAEAPESSQPAKKP